MLILTLPNGVKTGEVKINGERAEAQLDEASGTLKFRYLEKSNGAPAPWDVRKVLQTVNQVSGLTTYCCSNAADA